MATSEVPAPPGLEHLSPSDGYENGSANSGGYAAASDVPEANGRSAAAMRSALKASAAEFVPQGSSQDGDQEVGGEANLWKKPEIKGNLRQGWSDPITGNWAPYYVGKLKSFSHKNGFGFIECRETYALFGIDIFVHKNWVPHPWQIGQYVEFAVTQNSKGQPQASDTMWLQVADTPKLQPPASKTAAPGATPSVNAAGHRFLGTLKSFSTSQGYGFIACEEIYETTRRDTYLDRGQVQIQGGWRIGQTVEFEVQYNAQGHPQARKVDWDPIPFVPNQSGEMSDPRNRAIDNESMQTLQDIQKMLRKSDSDQVMEFVLGKQNTVNDGASTTWSGVDYVNFALDRLGPTPQDVCKNVKNFTHMLFLLTIGRMLSNRAHDKRADRLLEWLEASASAFVQEDSETDESNRQYYSRVIEQLKEFFSQISWANESTDEGLKAQRTLQGVVKLLDKKKQEKLDQDTD
eukprot:gnl/MRDRNA2_/MRDRNA2_132444_c0_seq1.p1 gnl/MRDRNA2_/MRDRNA2_132444_c0~~gnl/MRDRNA2_/MRDRNA2_132444_c0_seq1.p1  ORF type:complete len:480 (-),score=83.59 gnl/MRDRNA2_/MRDRNA2_132444_c0_seq1:20-1402(-)